MRQLLRQPRSQLIAILAVAILIRLWGIASRPIWYDEAFSILFAEKGPAAMLSGTLAAPGLAAAEEHPLGYYMLIWGWMDIFGRSLPAVRALSILAGLGVVALIYLIGRELFTERIGLLSALFAALAPFQVHYSQEIRMYVFLGLWLMLATFAFLRGRRTRRWEWWAAFALAAALAQYTHTLASLYLFPLALTPLLQRDWRTLKSTLLSALAAVLLYVPWLIQVPAQLAKVSSAYWLSRPGIEKFFTLILIFITNLPLPQGWLIPALSISLFILFLCFWQTLYMLRTGDEKGRAGLWLLYLSFAPPLLSFVLSQWRPIFLERTFLPSAAIFCIWVAWSLFSTRLPGFVQVIAVAALLSGALVGIYQHIFYAGFPYAPYLDLQAGLAARFRPGDVIIHSSKLSLLPAVYQNGKLEQVYIDDPAGSSVDTLAPATQQVLGVTSRPEIDTAVGDARRVWFIIFQQSIDEYVVTGRETHPQLGWLEENLHLESVESLNDLRLYLFSR